MLNFKSVNSLEQVTGIMLKILDAYRKQTYIAPRVLQQCLSYLKQGFV